MVKDRTDRKSKKAQEWRKAVLERDGNKCMHCDKTIQLCSHHIKEWDEYPELRYDVDNGLTLCRACHIKIHKPKEGATGAIPWNKGLTGLSTGWQKGKKFSDEHKAKLSEAKVGFNPWNIGIPMKDSTKEIQRKRYEGKKWIIDPDTGKRKWID